MRHRHMLPMAALALALAALAACAPPTGPGGPLPGNCAPAGRTVRCIFTYDGKDGTDGTVQTFVVPAGVHSVTIEAWGAQGGSIPDPQFAGGGLGGHARGVVQVTPGTSLSVRVGGQPTTSAAGFNGGGTGLYGGGGASDVRIGGDGLAARVVVAGGGGGEGMLNDAGSILDIPGGAGGGPIGLSPCQVVTPSGSSQVQGCGGGGTATAGGAAHASGAGCGPSSVTDPQAGSAGMGGNGGMASCVVGTCCVETVTGSGGGGGWFGGGGGSAELDLSPMVELSAAGGGGSGYVVPSATNPLNEAGVRAGNGFVTFTYTQP